MMTPEYPNSPILHYRARLMPIIRVRDSYELEAYARMREIGDVTFTAHPNVHPGMVEVYGNGDKIQNWSEIGQWMDRVSRFFQSIGTEAFVEWYLIDREFVANHNSFGQVEIDEEGFRCVIFTFGGPIKEWVRVPLSSYRLTD